MGENTPRARRQARKQLQVLQCVDERPWVGKRAGEKEGRGTGSKQRGLGGEREGWTEGCTGGGRKGNDQTWR